MTIFQQFSQFVIQSVTKKYFSHTIILYLPTCFYSTYCQQFFLIADRRIRKILCHLGSRVPLKKFTSGHWRDITGMVIKQTTPISSEIRSNSLCDFDSRSLWNYVLSTWEYNYTLNCAGSCTKNCDICDLRHMDLLTPTVIVGDLLPFDLAATETMQERLFSLWN